MTTPITRILHLEDNLLDAELIRDRLELEGLKCEIEVTVDHEQFASALATKVWDLVLCDYNVPGYDGGAALQLVRKHFPRLPVIMISSALSEEEAVKCLHMGATDYLLKQSLARLPSAVIRALDQARTDALREQAEQKFRSLLEFAPDAMVIVAADGTINLLNTEAEKLFGYRREELLGQPLTLLIPERYRKMHGAHLGHYFSCPTHKTIRTGFELVGLRKNGTEIPVDISLSPLETLEGVLAISTIRDMTERRKLEAQLVRAERMESIGSFAGNIAHDLNNALSPVLMSLEMIRLQNPESADFVDMVESGAKRGADMLRQLLVFSKGSFFDPKEVHPKEVLDDLALLIQRSFPKAIRLRTQFAPVLDRILGDSTQLHQVLLNLCVNARDAMPDGGNLTLSAENVLIDTHFASVIPNAVPGRYVLFRVSDTGSGISSDVLDRIFEPFFTTKAQGKGTGLGLSIVVGIIRSHRGFINAYSVLGKGSTFSVYLPVDDNRRVNEAIQQSVLADLRGNGEKILVVDDSEGIRGAASAVLGAMDFQVVTAADGIEALQTIAEHGEDIAAVITDLHMPRMGGHMFVMELKKLLPDVEVVVTSGNLDEESVSDFRALGVREFLEKPFTQEKLTGALRSVFHR